MQDGEYGLRRIPLPGTSVNINVREDLITLRVDLPVWDRVFIVNRLVEVGNGAVRGPGVNDMKGWH